MVARVNAIANVAKDASIAVVRIGRREKNSFGNTSTAAVAVDVEVEELDGGAGEAGKERTCAGRFVVSVIERATVPAVAEPPPSR